MGLNRYREDTSGILQLSGSDNAYTVRTNLEHRGYFRGMWLRARVNHTNDGDATLNVNGIGDEWIRLIGGSPLEGGELVEGGIYDFIHTGFWFQVIGLPAGAELDFVLAPNGADVVISPDNSQVLPPSSS